MIVATPSATVTSGASKSAVDCSALDLTSSGVRKNECLPPAAAVASARTG
ncbi:hypothetical protein [Salana multivorans]